MAIILDPESLKTDISELLAKARGRLIVLKNEGDAATAKKLLEDWYGEMLREFVAAPAPVSGPYYPRPDEYKGRELADSVKMYLEKVRRERVNVEKEIWPALIKGNAGPDKSPLLKRDKGRQIGDIKKSIRQNSPLYNLEKMTQETKTFDYDEIAGTVSLWREKV